MRKKGMDEDPPTAKPWPHAPPHWVFEPGIFMVTASTYQRKRILDAPGILDAVTHLMLDTAAEFGWGMRARAVLKNHYHFLAGSPERTAGSLRPWLIDFHRRTAMEVNRLAGCAGRRVWMNFWESRITHQTSYLARLRYVNQNPVHHRIVEDATQYRWCSARWFETNAPKSFVASVSRFKTDTLNVRDDFDDEEEAAES
jgi:putative transposase